VDLLKAVESEQLRDDLPDFSVGDRVRVHIKVVEGEKERTQAFEGTVIAIKHGGMNETFTVRRVSYGEGVERIFPLNSPSIDRIDILTRGSTRRAKLYYLRGRSGKGSRIREARR
jgi:large subunit ribosomal protein L19